MTDLGSSFRRLWLASAQSILPAIVGRDALSEANGRLQGVELPDELLGRMNAAYRLLGWGTMPIGAALGGLLAAWLGLRATFALAAAVHLPLLAGFLVVTDARIAAAVRAPSATLPE